MAKIKSAVVLALFLTVLFSTNVLANNYGFVSSNIWVSDNSPMRGETIKVSSVVINDSDKQFRGDVTFFDNDSAISSSMAFSLEAKESSKVLSVDWTCEPVGEHRFKAEITNAHFINAEGQIEPIDGSFFSQVTDIIYVDVDTDEDGVPDREEQEQGTDPNNPDSDGDTENDSVDPDPTDPTVFNGPDTDGDGIIDELDSDMDNDGLYNWEEDEIGTDPKKYDTDGDTFSDKEDKFPLDSNKWKDESEFADSIDKNENEKRANDLIDAENDSADEQNSSSKDSYAEFLNLNDSENGNNKKEITAEELGLHKQDNFSQNESNDKKVKIGNFSVKEKTLKISLIPLGLLLFLFAAEAVRRKGKIKMK